MSLDGSTQSANYDTAASELCEIDRRDGLKIGPLCEFLRRYSPPVLNQQDHYKLRLMAGVLVVSRNQRSAD